MARSGRSFPSRPQYGRNRNYKQPYNLTKTFSNEAGVATDWTITTTGGTVTEVTTRFHDGAQSLRINRTSNARVEALSTSHGWGASRINSGEFWIYVASLPTGTLPIFQLGWFAGNNLEVRLSPTGQVTVCREGGATASSPSATLITVGAWFKISFWFDSSTGTMLGRVAVNNDTPVSVSWAQTAEAASEWVFGPWLQLGVSLSDIYYDEGYAYTGWIPDPTPSVGTPQPVHAWLNEQQLASDYTTTGSVGGTAVLSTTQHQTGAQSLRITRTSNDDCRAQFDFNWDGSRLNCGSFWVYVTSYPTVKAPIASYIFGTGDNLEIQMGTAGQVAVVRQNNAGTTSSNSATSVSLNTWTKISWWADSSGATMIGRCAVGSDTPVQVTWAQAAETPTAWTFGARNAAIASTWDMFFDTAYTYLNWTVPVDPVYDLTPFPSVAVIDNFNRANVGPPPSASWSSDIKGNGTDIGFKVVSNELASSAALTTNGATEWWNATSFNSDEEVFVTQSVGGGSSFFELWARVSNPGTTNATSVVLNVFHGALNFQKYVAGVYTPLSGNVAHVLDVGWGVGFRVRNTELTAWVKPPGGVWTLLARQYDGQVMTGSFVGQALYDSNLTYDDFGAGSFVPGAVLNAVTTPVAGTSTATVTALKIKLPNRTSAGSTVTTSTTALKIRLPSRTSAGTSTATATTLKIKLPVVTTVITPRLDLNHGVTSAVISVNTLDFSTVAAVKAGAYLIVSGASQNETLTFDSIAVVSGVDPGNLNWAIVYLPSISGSLVIFAATLCPTGVQSGVTFRGTWSGANTARIIGLSEWNGINRDPSFLEDAQGAQAAVGDPSATVTTLTTNALVFGVYANSNATTSTPTAPAIELHDASAGSRTLGAGYKVVGSAGSYSIGADMATNADWVSAALAMAKGQNSFAYASDLTLGGGGGLSLPVESSAGSSTATAAALRIKLPNRTSTGTGTGSANNIKIRLPSRTSAGTSTATAAAVRDRLPNVTTAGTSTATATALKIRLPNRTSASSSTAAAAAFKVRLPSRASAGVGTLTANNIKIRLPNCTSAGSSTSTAAAFKIQLPNRTSAGTSTSTTNSFKHIRLPGQTSAGVSTTNGTALTLSGGGAFPIPAETSDGTSTAIAAALRIRLPNRTTSGTGTATATGLKIRLPSRASSGAGTATAALRVRLPNRTTVGSSTATATAFKIRLPSRTSAGTSTATATAVRDRLPNLTSAGSSTATAQAFRIRLPNLTSASIATATGVGLSLAGGGAFPLPSRASNGTSSATAAALRIRLPSQASAGVGTTTAPLRIRLPNRSSTGATTATATALKIRLPSRTSTGTATATAAALRIRLPNRTFAGTSTATATAFAKRLQSATSAGVGAVTANNIKIRLPARTSSATSSTNASGLFPGGPILLLAVVSAGISSTSAVALRIRLPNRSSAGTGAASASLRIRLPNRTSVGSSSVSGNNLRIRLPNRTSVSTSNATAQALSARLPVRTSAGVGTATASGLRIRLPNRTSVGTSTTVQAGLKDRIGQVTSAGTSSLTTSGLKIRLPSRTSTGTSSTTAAIIAGSLPVESSSGASTATATAFRIRLPARTSAGTSTATTSGLKDRMGQVSSTGSSSTIATSFRIRLPNVNVLPLKPDTPLGPDTVLIPGLLTTAVARGFAIRLPARFSQGTSSTTIVPLRVGLIVFSDGSSTAAASAFRIKLPSATSSGTGGDFASSFIYIPPPAKVVVANGGIHSLVASSTTHVFAGAIGGGTVTASSSKAVTTSGDLTKTVVVGP